MKIDAVTAHCTDTGTVQPTLIAQMTEKGMNPKWAFFSGDLNGRSLRAEGEIYLLSLKGDPDAPAFRKQRDAVRKGLSSLDLKMTYSDVYGKVVGTEGRDLSWFGRHFIDND